MAWPDDHPAQTSVPGPGRARPALPEWARACTARWRPVRVPAWLACRAAGAAVASGLLLGGAAHAAPGPATAMPPAAATPIVLQQAFFQQLDGGATGAWQPVALPDTWAARGLPQAGAGHYRLQLALPEAPQGVWALRIDRLSTVHRLRVNGVLVQQRGPEPDAPAAQPAVTLPVLAEFPAQLLRQGDNQIDVEWRLGSRAGLSQVQVGPGAALQRDFDRDRLLDRSLPQLMNAAGAGLAVFMLLIWWQRRRESAFGLFGLLWGLVSLRNFAYYAQANPLPGELAGAVFFVAQGESVVLLGAFAIAMSQQPWPRFQRLLWVLALAMPLLALVGALTGLLAPLRAVIYPGLSLLSLGALAVLWHTVRRLRRWTLLALALGLAGVVCAGAHDYLYLQGLLPVTHFYALPFAVPLGCMWFALVLVQRMVQALRSSEEQAARLEARVAERTQALHEAHLAQGRFLAAASHDLRQPVTAIGLLVGLVREREQAPAQRRLLDQAQAAARSLEDLLRGLLDLSRLDSEAAAPQHQPVPLQALFDAIAAHEGPAAQARGLRLRFVPTGAVVLSDPALLDQVLRNLVGNALRYTPRGAVLVAARRSAQGLRLQVRDSGLGMAAADQQRVFEPFVQLNNPGRDRARGQGLGLAIVRRSVDLLGHALTLRSAPGRGSCFSLALPLVVPADQACAGPADDAAAPALPLAGLRVWLLDDDPAVRQALAERLSAWGAQVRPHGSLADLAQTLASRTPAPDWLLTDHRLPDGDGLQAVDQVRALRGQVPVLVLTGDTAPALSARCAQQGLAVLHKPFKPAQLLGEWQRVSGSG